MCILHVYVYFQYYHSVLEVIGLWLTIPPILTKWTATSHLKSLTIRKTATFANGNICTSLWWICLGFFGAVLLCVFMIWILCCDVHCDFRIQTIFSSSLHPVVCRRAHALFALFVFVAHSGVQHILCCVFAVFVLVLCIICC
jgi:hypothetical protein